MKRSPVHSRIFPHEWCGPTGFAGPHAAGQGPGGAVGASGKIPRQIFSSERVAPAPHVPILPRSAILCLTSHNRPGHRRAPHAPRGDHLRPRLSLRDGANRHLRPAATRMRPGRQPDVFGVFHLACEDVRRASSFSQCDMSGGVDEPGEAPAFVTVVPRMRQAGKVTWRGDPSSSSGCGPSAAPMVKTPAGTGAWLSSVAMGTGRYSATSFFANSVIRICLTR